LNPVRWGRRIKQGYITPIKEDVKGNLYPEGDVVKKLWQL